MARMPKHKLPRGRLKKDSSGFGRGLDHERPEPGRTSGLAASLTTQCFSIIVIFLLLVLVNVSTAMSTRPGSTVAAQAERVAMLLKPTLPSLATAQPITMAPLSSSTEARVTGTSEATTMANKGDGVLRLRDNISTTPSGDLAKRADSPGTRRNEEIMTQIKNYPPIGRLEKGTEEEAAEVEQQYRRRGNEGRSVTATISNTLGAFKSSSNGPAAAAAWGEDEMMERRRTVQSETDETELLPQNDQPSRLGTRTDDEAALAGGQGLFRSGGGGGGGGGYYYGNDNNMSNGNGKFGANQQGTSSSSAMLANRNQNNQSGSVVVPANGNADNRKGFTDIDIQCPSLTENSACPCYKFDDGLVLECPGTTAFSLRTTLQLITAPIQSLSVYDFDRSVTTLNQDVFSGKLHIRHLQFSHSHLEVLADNALKSISGSLESLSIVNGKLTRIPHTAISLMDRLTMIDFEANNIRAVEAESFEGLHLAKLNLKSNRIETIQSNAFKGVEMTLSEIDLSDNKLRAFPLAVLRQLDNLRSLRLALNEMSALIWDGHTRLASLQFLDLSSNQFVELGEHFFHPFAKLKTLSLYSNAIKFIHRHALQYLKDLVSVDVSHNNLIALDRHIFEANKKLQTIDLSHNHLHYVDDMFTNLPFLREVFLSENNILELSRDVFTNSTRITVIYLENNAIRRLDDHLLTTLVHLQQLYLSNSFIAAVGEDFLRPAAEVTSLSLDGNWIGGALERGLFRSMTHLRELRLHGNRIRQIHRNVFHPLPALIELHLQSNLIKAIEADAFASLTSLLHLNLQHNQLYRLEAVLPKAPGTALTSVQLDSNRLSTTVGDAVWRGQRHLQILWLSNNQLTTLNRELFVDLVGVERLYLMNNSIGKVDSDTFKAMTSLKLIDLSGNSLTEVKRQHFSPHLVDLEELILRANRIQTIETRSFDKLRKLRVLDLSGNFITKLTKDMFQDDLQLNVVLLQGARVRHIEPGTFRNLNNLNELNLEENELRAEDVRQLDVPSLRILRLSNNIGLNQSERADNRYYAHSNASKLDGMFDKLPSLQILRLANCSIFELPELLFTKNTNLVRIELSYNHLRFLPRNLFTGMNVLKELRLTGNILSEFPHHALSNISTLETLVVGRNQLTSVDFSKLNGIPNVRHLELRDNLISSMGGFSAVNVTQLDFVDLSGNYLLALPTNFFYNSINLHRVDLSRNRFQHIPSNALGDNSLPRLGWLNLSGNPLNVFYDSSQSSQQPPIRFSFLKELHIRDTNLTILTSQDFQAFPGLQQLHMSHNRINRISPGAFNGLKNLLSLDVSVNELEKLPKERLQGLRLLRHLNLSHNVLKELDEFPEDLVQVRQLDLSFNQLSKLGKTALRNLINLNELHLVGNRLKAVAAEAFRNVHKLQLLDFRQNYFEHIPLVAVQVVEAHLKSLKIEDNPIQCTCDTQELWEWLRNHLKLILSSGGRNSDTMGGGGRISGDHNSHDKQAGPKATDDQQQRPPFKEGDLLGDQGFMAADRDSLDGDGDAGDVELLASHLRCDQPPRLRGQILMDMEPHRFCDAPMILKMAIQDIRPYSVLVSWQPREHAGLHGYHVVYRSMEAELNEVRSTTLDRWATSAKLFKLLPGTQYEICVVGIGTWGHTTPLAGDLVKSLGSTSYYYSPDTSAGGAKGAFGGQRTSERTALEALLSNNVTTKCQEVVTLDTEARLMAEELEIASMNFIKSLLSRRLGLIVGCCLGIIVFIVLASVLSWLKIKKRRVLEETKRMQPMPPDFISYRHFSIPNEEHNRILQTGVDIGQSVGGTLSRGGGGHSHQHHHHSHGGGGGGNAAAGAAGRASYISRNELSTPLMTSTANGTSDDDGVGAGGGETRPGTKSS